MRAIRFGQITTASGILTGRVRRSQIRKCEMCYSLVSLDSIVAHTKWHFGVNDGPQRMDPGMTENRGDRIVALGDDNGRTVAEVRSI